MRIAAIDPGISGAVALVDTTTSEALVADLPTIALGKRNTINPYSLASVLREWAPNLLVIEHVATRPGQGVSSSGNFMYGAGVLFGVAGALGLEVDFVPPATWKRGLNLLGTSKEASRSLALRLFPALQSELKRKKDSDRAEALLIAHHYAVKVAGHVASARPLLRVVASAEPLPSTPSPSRLVARRDSSTPVIRRAGFRTRR